MMPVGTGAPSLRAGHASPGPETATPAFAPPQRSVVFTGNLTADFGSGPLYVNRNASAWGASNNISAFFAAYNATELFLGFQEIVTSNSLMIFLGSDGAGGLGTYNLAGLNAWSRSISFSSPVLDVIGVYFGGTNSNRSGYGAWQVLTPPSDSNGTESDRGIFSLADFQASTDAAEVALPLREVLPVLPLGRGNVTVSAFVVGGSGAWVGTGVPYAQTGVYNAGGSLTTFLVDDPFVLDLTGLPVRAGVPNDDAIDYNEHQPVYEVAGNGTYNLPWTEAHATAEYIEQAVILHAFPSVNITYELSGSLLWQLVNISQDPGFNDSFIQGAYVPYQELNTSQNRSLLAALTTDYFSVPPYVYGFPEPASRLYQQLQTRWSQGWALNASQYEDAKVLWFLYEISTDLVEGRLGPGWVAPSIWALHNASTFTQRDLRTVLAYARTLTGEVVGAFAADRWGNRSGSDNAELFTSPFYHPLTPLLLTPSIRGPGGSLLKGVYASDVLAQLNLSRDQFATLFGAYPRGLYASEAAVSEAMVPLLASSGAQWTATDEWTLQRSGVGALAFGDPGTSVAAMEALYTPYIVQGANGSSTRMIFRDAPLSNNWAFNYGGLPTSTVVADIVDYLKGINATLPVGDHPRTLVTLMLDGENWQFMAPFADDGVPFLQALYRALAQNASSLRTVTPSQFLDDVAAQEVLLPGLTSVATGSWNQASGQAAPLQSNPSLTQWSGYNTQDWMWVALDRVRQKVLQVQQNHSLVQLENMTAFEQNLSAPTWEGNLTRAWYGIYNAEGSDWFFQMAPWTISGANTGPFNTTFQGDLAYALGQLAGPSAPPPPPPPSLSVTVQPNATVLHAGGRVQLNASVQGGIAPYGILWVENGTNTTQTGPTWALPLPHAGNYTFGAWATDPQGDAAASPAVRVAVLPTTPLVPPLALRLASNTTLLRAGGSVGLSVSVQGGVPPIALRWSLNGSNQSSLGTSASTTVLLGHPGNYTYAVWGRDALGTEARSAPVTVEVLPLPSSGGPPVGGGGSGGGGGGGGGAGAGPGGALSLELLLGAAGGVGMATAVYVLLRRRSAPPPSSEEGPSEGPSAPEGR